MKPRSITGLLAGLLVAKGGAPKDGGVATGAASACFGAGADGVEATDTGAGGGPRGAVAGGAAGAAAGAVRLVKSSESISDSI